MVGAPRVPNTFLVLGAWEQVFGALRGPKTKKRGLARPSKQQKVPQEPQIRISLRVPFEVAFWGFAFLDHFGDFSLFRFFDFCLHMLCVLLFFGAAFKNGVVSCFATQAALLVHIFEHCSTTKKTKQYTFV